jgi:hypothetical protein
VAGLTTAASIWMAAALGMAAGGGAFPLAIVATVVSVIVLRLPRERLRPRSPQRRGGRPAAGEPSGLFPGRHARPAAEALGLSRAPRHPGRGSAHRRARPPRR